MTASGAPGLGSIYAPRRADDAARLVVDLREARQRTLDLLDDVEGEAWFGPELGTVNPPIWELGHVGWFQERFVLRELGAAPMRADGDALYDSSDVVHGTRWRLAFPDPDETRAYLAAILEATVDVVARRGDDPAVADLARLVLAHEDMHAEAFLYTRQTLGRPAPAFLDAARDAGEIVPQADVVIRPDGPVRLGVERDALHYAFDNEFEAHDVEVAPFAIARRPVSELEFAAFVADGGYVRRELWSEAGWLWREATGARAPAAWQQVGDGWVRRVFDAVVPLSERRPVFDVSAHEAEAWCRWADRRLPTEAEWELAARGPERRPWPWGATPPTAAHAVLDQRHGEPGPFSAGVAGATPEGVLQLVGNVWEWTATPFAPFPGFRPGVYADYSAPWFEGRRVLKGGSFATRARLAHAGYRNYFPPDRVDVLAGFRTVARAVP